MTRRSSSRLPRRPPLSCRNCSKPTACSRCRDSRGRATDHAGPARNARQRVACCDLLRTLAHELAGLADDGDVDIGRARPLSWPIGDVDAAQIETIQGFQGRDQLLPRRPWTGPLQPFHHKPAGPRPTREKLVAALESLNRFDLGGVDVTYGPGIRTGTSYIDITIVGKSGKFMR